MAKLTDYTADTRLVKNDILIKDGTGGTKKITAENAAIELAGLISPVMHRNIYRGKSLGTEVTEEQKNAIKTGTFDNLFIGDYWTLGEKKYVIADMDYWYRCGDTDFTTHHLVMVPDVNMYDHVMNGDASTEGGYTGSKMYTEGLVQAKEAISTAFGDMLLTHKEILVNAVKDGYASGYEWVESQVDLMNEIMVYGCHVYTPGSTGTVTPINYTIDNSQLALFKLYPGAYKKRANFWLRDVVSSGLFAYVAAYGNARSNPASYSNGVRPAFAVGVATV